jgi:hypothetical protein
VKFPNEGAVQVVAEFVDDVLPERRRFVVARGREVGGEFTRVAHVDAVPVHSIWQFANTN